MLGMNKFFNIDLDIHKNCPEHRRYADAGRIDELYPTLRFQFSTKIPHNLYIVGGVEGICQYQLSLVDCKR